MCGWWVCIMLSPFTLFHIRPWPGEVVEAWALTLKVITPCVEERSGNERLHAK